MKGLQGAAQTRGQGCRPPLSRFVRCAQSLAGWAGCVALLGCKSSIEVGAWKCAAAPLFEPPDGSLIPPGKDTIVLPRWSSSFENGFCGYAEARGYCYTDPDAIYDVTDTVARTGRRAAAFTITTDDAKVGRQARCVREGRLPQDAYYGAWFYIPTRAVNNGNWNLIHFQGASGEEDPPLRGLWDVSIDTSEDGRMLPRLVRLIGRGPPATHADVELPVAKWFSIQLRLKRDAAESGIAALYLDGDLVAEYSNIVTDDTAWGQWYVGNLADNLEPQESTVYVDDVSIQPSLTEDN
jgi:hypothetical protein